jgi:hypothetical protein
MPTTMRQLRNNIADAAKDRLHLIATSGSTSTLIDPVELTDYDDTLAGSQLLFTTGSNEGAIVRVLSNSLSSTSLTFYPDVSNAVVAGDEADLFNISNKGFRVRQYNQAIQTVVGGRTYKNVVEATFSWEEFDADDATMDVSDAFIGIYDVQADLGYDIVRPIRWSPWNGGNGWWVDTATRTLRIGGSSAQISHGSTLTIHGYQAVNAPTADDDEIFLDEEYVRWACIAQLFMNKSPQHDRWAAEAITNMRNRESFVTPVLHRNTQFLNESSS